jgi:glycosyltransferase involved in cell wall biosynthesis
VGDPLLSLVVPVYNVAPYLDDLVRSIAAQWDERVEVIFVEDVSTDNSAEVLRNLVQTLPRHRTSIVAHERNLGLSEARNSGILAASGQYIWCIDSDDCLSEGSVQGALGALEEFHPSLLLVDFSYIEASQPAHAQARDACFLQCSRGPYRSLPRRTPLTKAEIAQSFARDMQFYAWSVLVRREIAKAILFPPGKLFEDMCTIPRWALAADTAIYVPIPGAAYRDRNESISRKPVAKNLLDLAAAFLSVIEANRRYQADSLPQRFLYSVQIQALIWAARDLITSGEMKKPGVDEKFAGLLRSTRTAFGLDVFAAHQTHIWARGRKQGLLGITVLHSLPVFRALVQRKWSRH